MMSEAKSPPPLGGIRPVFEVTCGAGSEPNLCGKPATWHLIWDDDTENSLSCDECRAWAHKRWIVHDEHPLCETCTVPDRSIIWSWDEPPGRCVWIVSEETHALNMAADMEHAR